MDRSKSLIAIAGVGIALLVLVGGLWFFAGRNAAPPPVTPVAPPVEDPVDEEPEEVVLVPVASPTPIPKEPTTQDEPNPSSPEPEDPMAEFRVEPFTGFVLDAEQMEPIPGAQVTAYLFDRGVYRLGENYPAVLETVTADSMGRFRFPEREIADDETLGWRATAPDYSTDILLFPGGQGQGDRLRTSFLLKSSAPISGTVVDEAGAPVPNAIVGEIVMAQDGSKPGEAGEWAQPSFWAISDEDGAFTLEGAAFGETFKLPARATGYIATVTDPVGPGAADVRIVLVRAESALEGSVMDYEGEPVKDAYVEIQWNGSRQITFDRLSMRARTNTRGSFSFPDLPSGPFLVSAETEQKEALGLGQRADKEVVLLPGRTTEVELRLPAPATINGRFQDYETGEGVPGVILYSNIEEAMAREAAYKVESNEKGFFNFTAFIPDYPQGYEVRVPVEYPEGYFPREARDDESRGVVVEQNYLSFPAVKPNERRTALVNLEKGTRLTGRVIEPDGSEPGDELPVFFESSGFATNVTTALDGTFELDVPLGRELRIESSSANGIGNMFITPAGEEEIELQLLEYARVSGTVYEPDGSPRPETFLEVTRPQNRKAFRPAIRFEEKDYTGDDGTFDIENVGPDTVLLNVRISGGSYARPEPVVVELTPGEHRQGVEIRLKESAVISGSVVDAITNEPLEGVTLTTDRSDVAGSTDKDGKFELKGMTGERPLAFVTAFKQGYSEKTRQNVSIQDDDLVFRLEPRGDLLVRVTGGGGGVSNFNLRLLMDAPDQPGDTMAVYTQRYVTNSDGSVLLEDVPPGYYRAEVTEINDAGENGASGAEEFDFAPGASGQQVVEVALEGNLTLRGEVVKADGAPAPGAEVELLNPPLGFVDTSGPPSAQRYVVRAGGGGSFQIEELPAGTYILRARTDREVSEKVRVTLIADMAPVRLEMQPSPRVYGRVYGADADPIKRATMFFMPVGGTPEGPPLEVRDGDYEMRLNGAGDWQVAVSDDLTGDSTTRYFTVEPGEERELNIDFSERVTLRGKILIDGEPAKSRNAIRLLSFEGRETLLIPEEFEGGAYEAKVFPGDYFAWFDNGTFQTPLSQTRTIAPDPEEQTQNFNVDLGSLDLQIVGAEETYLGGRMTLEAQVDGQAVPLLQEWTIDRPTLRFLQLPAGTYRGIFFRDGNRLGESSWVPVQAGQDMVMTVEVTE